MIRNINPFSAEYYYSPTDLKCSSAFEPQDFNMLLVMGDQDTSIHIQSDIELLRREQEYAKQHPELFQKFFASIAPDSPVSELSHNLSDDELKLFLKSRRFQSPAEMQQYVEYLNQVYDGQVENLSIKAKQIIEDFKASYVNNEPNVQDPSKPSE